MCLSSPAPGQHDDELAAGHLTLVRPCKRPTAAPSVLFSPRFDDLRRNYVLNKQQGLVIRPFKKAHLTRDTDRQAGRLDATDGRHTWWACVASRVPTDAAPARCARAPLRHRAAAACFHHARREMLYLSAYLGKIAGLESLAELNHR